MTRIKLTVEIGDGTRFSVEGDIVPPDPTAGTAQFVEDIGVSTLTGSVERLPDEEKLLEVALESLAEFAESVWG